MSEQMNSIQASVSAFTTVFVTLDVSCVVVSDTSKCQVTLRPRCPVCNHSPVCLVASACHITQSVTGGQWRFLADVNSRSRSLLLCHRPSVSLSSVCLSVTFVRPTQAIEIFGDVSNHLVRSPSADIQVKFYGDRPREPLRWGVKHKRGSRI